MKPVPSEILISYAKLWKQLIDKKINKTELKDKARISTNAVAKMGRDEPVSMETLGKVCVALDCEIGDIVEITKGVITKNDDY